MNLPVDFSEALDNISTAGVLSEDISSVGERLDLTLREIALGEGQVVDLGVLDWATKLRRAFEAAIRQEVCDPEKRALKTQYQSLLTQGITPESVAAVAPLVLKSVAAVNPAFAVSTVAIYFGVWLLKVGLNYWCATSS